MFEKVFMYLKKQYLLLKNKTNFDFNSRAFVSRNLVILSIAIAGVFVSATNVYAVRLADYPKLQAVADELIAQEHY